ncbi:MAG: apolipoprotein N-acyltransferase [Chthoniobacterales bacterium]|nr:apolipoprotein N-acyltransferase [Chthoniobacterales bacterium]
MISFFKRYFPYALLTGALMATGFPPYDMAFLSWVPWIAFTPLCWVLLVEPLPERFLSQVSHAFFLGFLAGSTFFLLTLEWITSVAWEGLVTLPFYLGLYAGVWAMTVVILRSCLGDIFWRYSRKNLGVSLFAAASWSGLEWARGTLFTGFGWNSFGVAFHRSIPLLQLCDITGVGGLSFLGVMTGCVVALAMKRFVDEVQKKKITTSLRMRPHGDLLITLLVIVMVICYGLRELLAPAPLQERLSIAAIQGNIPQNHKWDRSFEEEIMSTYLRRSAMALALRPDLIVWPEAAVPRPLLQDQATFNRVQQLAQQGEADFLMGSLDYEENPRHDYNAAILLTHHASSAQVYAKVHLLPFGEYIPCRKSFPFFAWVTGDRILGDFDAGPGPKLLELSTKPVHVAPLLCFEDTLGDLVRRFAGLGAQAIITLTNDGWFGHTAASKQHMVNALFRCAETKLPMLRVANTGVTCVIDRFGRVIEILQAPDGSTFLEGILATQWNVPANPTTTFYTKHGDLFAKGCLGIMLVSLMVFLFGRKERKRSLLVIKSAKRSSA